jgi:hypothetical protein
VVIDHCLVVGIEDKLVSSRLFQKRSNLGLENSQWLSAILDLNKYLPMLHSIGVGPEDIGCDQSETESQEETQYNQQ